MKYKLYLIENLINSKKYVGYTKNTVNKRFIQHSYSNKPLGKAIRLYGKDKFAITAIDQADDLETALELEKKWILHYNTFGCMGYNCTKGGDCSPVCRNTNSYKTKEFSNKVRNNAIKQHADPKKKLAHVEGIRNYWKTLDREQLERRKQIAVENGKKSKVAWNKGLKFPGSGMVGSKNPMAKQYKVWYPDGTKTVVNCLSSFCRENCLTYRNACAVIEGKQQHHKGFRFARLENDHP